MVSALTLTEEIYAAKTRRGATILAHHYQEPEIQEVADAVGDSLELVRFAKGVNGGVIAVCAMRFIAEAVKVLNSDAIVILPDKDAGCSLADSCPVEAVRAFKRRNPQHVVVSYFNTSAEVKAESDFICTSQNAVAVVKSIPAHQPILFLPDINLGEYVRKKTDRKNMTIWQGACILHATFSARRVSAARARHPRAPVAAHPECSGEILRIADFIGSPSAIVEWCAAHPAQEFIVVTESGIRRALEARAPGKTFHFVANEHCNCSECPYMRLNSLEKLLACLETLEPRIELPASVMQSARRPLDRMLAVQ